MVGTGYLIKLLTLWVYLGTMAYGLLAFETTQITEYPPGQWETVIENQEFTQTLNLDSEDDDILIINSTFHDIADNALMIRNVKNVYIKNCLIYDIDGDGIVLRSTGSTQNVTIDGCTIYNIGRNGIIAKQRSEEGVDHINLIIKNNTIYNTGQSEYDHSMYIQSTDSLIENNVMYGSSGNGISIRSSGTVRGNKIWDTQKSCIRYYNDHAPGASNALYIENNICYQTNADEGHPALSLLWANLAPQAYLVQNYYIRFNTVVLFTAERYGFAVEDSVFGAKHIELYGNIFVNTQDISKTLNAQYVDYNSSNYTSTSLQGFVNPTKEPYDFHLTADSPARYFASTEPHFPLTDINGTTRVSEYLDAGAYQFSVKLSTEKPVTEGQERPVVETADSPSANLAAPILESQAKPAPNILDEPSVLQSSQLSDKLLYFILLIGLLIIVGIAAKVYFHLQVKADD